ncbi:single-stranded-DNA-specific exonuclease RecJ [Capnocytophaga sp. G2]|uniref:single-stranded-DNA-specific exonuclease RecJ n=1 Tax=Capnocytophaga sp. G2 TaxID=3110695 RepID=UPI002B466BF1|nr:single-stranded-DNA-specific exonuclease RecJ [Capnocytophaga sp. G2]MEB3004041.1 single-stranded-DNA-specific exonuclease RecJ [Capnocytophaga sp. G2]
MPNKLVWDFLPIPMQEEIETLSQTLFSSTLPWQKTIACLLLQRGIHSFKQAKEFFNPSLEQLHNPFVMKDMDRAVERILLAIKHKENILIYGDYDVDGTCSVSILYLFLSKVYPNVSTYVPDRYKEGYGISFQGIDYAVDNDVSLIITLDCGIKGHEKVQYAKGKGIEMIITDHHTPAETLPEAVAVLNPKRADCTYPYKELCGCGIGFKLIQALCKSLQLPSHTPYEFLDLVALATCADIVPITGENRVLVYFGLRQINEQPSQVMTLLLASVPPPIQVRDLVFVAAPRINAAGRMAHAQKAVDFLTQNALEEASCLEFLNHKRKGADEQITQEALEQIVSNHEEEASATVVFSKDWHKGVIGIVASRLTETYYRPTIVFTQSGDVLTASARSVKGYNLYEALCQCRDYLLQFGGHTAAAGMTLLPENYLPFKKRFQEIVAQTLPEALRKPAITLSVEMPLKEITLPFYRCLQRFAPFGPKNMTPIFLAYEVIAKNVFLMGNEGSHLRMTLTDSSLRQEFEAVGFGLGHKKSIVEKGQPFTIAYELSQNTWKGTTSLQLVIKDIMPMINMGNN